MPRGDVLCKLDFSRFSEIFPGISETAGFFMMLVTTSETKRELKSWGMSYFPVKMGSDVYFYSPESLKPVSTWWPWLNYGLSHMIDALVLWFSGVVSQALLLDLDVQKVTFLLGLSCGSGVTFASGVARSSKWLSSHSAIGKWRICWPERQPSLRKVDLGKIKRMRHTSSSANYLSPT